MKKKAVYYGKNKNEAMSYAKGDKKYYFPGKCKVIIGNKIASNQKVGFSKQRKNAYRVIFEKQNDGTSKSKIYLNDIR